MHILLISGSTRSGSSNTLALHKPHELDHRDFTSELYADLAELPAFVPTQDPVPTPVAHLLSRIDHADAAVKAPVGSSAPSSLRRRPHHRRRLRAPHP